MGAWGTAAFDNDDASDWVYELEDGGVAVVDAALDAALEADQLDGPTDVKRLPPARSWPPRVAARRRACATTSRPWQPVSRPRSRPTTRAVPGPPRSVCWRPQRWPGCGPRPAMTPSGGAW